MNTKLVLTAVAMAEIIATISLIVLGTLSPK